MPRPIPSPRPEKVGRLVVARTETGEADQLGSWVAVAV